MEENGVVDRALLEAFVAGDVPAFEALFERNHRWLLHHCRRHLGGDTLHAEDCAQETMMALARSAPCITGSVRAWLYTTARNVCASRLRREMRWAQVGIGRPQVLHDSPGRHSGSCAMSDRVLLRSAVIDALSVLPSRQREVLVLRHLYGLPQQLIALRMGVSEGAVESLLHRARRGLRALLVTDAAA